MGGVIPKPKGPLFGPGSILPKIDTTDLDKKAKQILIDKDYGTFGNALIDSTLPILGAARSLSKDTTPNVDLPPSPPVAPDLTDATIDLAAKQERDRMKTRQGRRSTFLTGQAADITAGPVTRKTLLGG